MKSIEKKWEPLASGEFRGMVEPACALCRAYIKASDIRSVWNSHLGCEGCSLINSQKRICYEGEHVYARWVDALEDVRARDGCSFRKAANSPRAVKAAGRVLASLRRAEKKLRKVVSK